MVNPMGTCVVLSLVPSLVLVPGLQKGQLAMLAAPMAVPVAARVVQAGLAALAAKAALLAATEKVPVGQQWLHYPSIF